MPHATINGRRIHHRDTGGDGTAVVLAHGCPMDREDLTDRLGEITCPALVVHGTEDTAILAGLPD